MPIFVSSPSETSSSCERPVTGTVSTRGDGEQQEREQDASHAAILAHGLTGYAGRRPS